jgi:hypothetical protein
MKASSTALVTALFYRSPSALRNVPGTVGANRIRQIW